MKPDTQNSSVLCPLILRHTGIKMRENGCATGRVAILEGGAHIRNQTGAVFCVGAVGLQDPGGRQHADQGCGHTGKRCHSR
ncbi:hypothetical protein D9M69_681270 [compost metagenome]